MTMPAEGYFGRNPTTKTGYHYTCIRCMDTQRTHWKAQALGREEREWEQELAEEAWIVTNAGRWLLYQEAKHEEIFAPGQVIYTLSDPYTSAVRYVGRTNNPKKRFEKHLYDASWYANWYEGELVFGNAKSRWIRELKREGLRPVMTVVEEVDPPELVHEREYRRIYHYVRQQAPLTNYLISFAPFLMRAVSTASLDYLCEPLESSAWLPLYQAYKQDLANHNVRNLAERTQSAMCSATNRTSLLRVAIELAYRGKWRNEQELG